MGKAIIEFTNEFLDDGAHLVNLDMSTALKAYEEPEHITAQEVLDRWNGKRLGYMFIDEETEFTKAAMDIMTYGTGIIKLPPDKKSSHALISATQYTINQMMSQTLTSSIEVTEVSPGFYEFSHNNIPYTGNFSEILQKQQDLGIMLTFKYYTTPPPTGWQGFSSNKDIDPPSGISTECNHSWKTYIGLTQVYDFCEICDTKKT